MFLDESRFCLQFTDGCKRVWRRRGERYRRNTFMQPHSFGGDALWFGEVFLTIGELAQRLYLKLKIKRNDWLLADVCPQATNHCALF